MKKSTLAAIVNLLNSDPPTDGKEVADCLAAVRKATESKIPDTTVIRVGNRTYSVSRRKPTTFIANGSKSVERPLLLDEHPPCPHYNPPMIFA